MANKDFLDVYPRSLNEAKRLDEVDHWKASRNESIACKDAIEASISRDFDGMHLKPDCAQGVIAAFGFHRVAHVLANSLQYKDYDGRFSRGNKEWAQRIHVTPDADSYRNLNVAFVVDSHPAVLDGFVNQYRNMYQRLGLFDQTHCQPDTAAQDFRGQILVLRADILKDAHLTPQDQLWLCTGGFGARQDARGRAVYATCLADDEKARWDRSDFAGVITDEHLPDWAGARLAALRGQEQTAGDTPEMGGMHMQ